MTTTASNFARKAAILIAGGGVYGTAVYCTYSYLQMNKEAAAAATTTTTSSSSSNNNNNNTLSLLDSPLRIQQFQRIADLYDERIQLDEFFMGINLLRRALLFFHAKVSL